MGEFAWSRFEPREGFYQFDWMDEAIGHPCGGRCQDHHVHANGDPAGVVDPPPPGDTPCGCQWPDGAPFWGAPPLLCQRAGVSRLHA